VENILGSMVRAIHRGDKIEIRGFGRFSTTHANHVKTVPIDLDGDREGDCHVEETGYGSHQPFPGRKRSLFKFWSRGGKNKRRILRTTVRQSYGPDESEWARKC